MDRNTRRVRQAKRAVRAGTTAVAWTIGGIIRLTVRIIATVLLIVVTTGLLFTCVFAYYVQTALVEDMDVRLEDFQDTVALTSTIEYYDKTTNRWETLQTLYSTVNTVWVSYDNIPEYMQYAAVAIEDKRFYEHRGVDWYRTVGAFSNMFLQMRDTFGGSTITQQLIKNLTKEDDITVQRKLLEIFRALDFERMYTKDQIMEWYLNSIFLGERCWGVGTAANTYFGKEVWDLSLAECASIIGITNNPSRYDPFISKSNNKERQETILFEMYDKGYISYEEYQQAVDEELEFVQGENEEYVEDVRSWYVDNVIRDVIRDLQDVKGYSKNLAQTLVYSGGYRIQACIDMDIQNIVDSVYQDRSQIPVGWGGATQELQSAIVILDQYTGNIVAMSGGIGDKTANLLHDRATIATRPPGSSFKPISVYAPALDLGLITQQTLVNDAAGITLKGTTWYPSNSGGGNMGIVSIRDAVRASLNTVAAQTLDKLGTSESYNYLTNHLGATSLVPEDINYAPLSLGQLTNGITVREMAQAYGALANNGVFRKGRMYSTVYDRNDNVVIDNTSEPEIAFKENTAWNMTDMLFNAVNYGTGTEARLPNMAVAGKTGTTSDNKDRYFVGYTPHYVAAVWTGYDTPEPMNFGASNPAAVIWRTIMSRVHEGMEYAAFPVPVLGAPTNIFGDLQPEKEEESPSPSVSPSPSPSVSPSPSPSVSPSTSPGVNTSPPPMTEPPVTESPPQTDPPQTEPPETEPPPQEPPPDAIEG